MGAVFLFLLSGLCWSRVSDRGDDERPDPEELLPGLVAEFRPIDDAYPRVTRRSPTLVDRWEHSVPDLRLPSDGFRSRWSGWLLVREEGDHRFRIHSDGPHQLRIGEGFIQGEGGRAALSDTISLKRGLIPIELTTTHRGDDRRITVDWEGPTFPFEHIPSSVLFHEDDDAAGTDPFELGRQLADRLGCANCHSIPGVFPHPSIGPSLEGEMTINRHWLVDWLVDPSERRRGTPMPGFQLDTNQASDIAAYLESVSRAPSELPLESQMAVNIADSSRGRLLFRSAGCLGCHDAGEPDGQDFRPEASVNLDGLGEKRSIDSVIRYLGGTSRSDPGRHRPELDLTADSAAHLAAYLTGTRSANAQARAERPDLGDPDRGHALIATVGCASCHQIPGVRSERDPIPLDVALALEDGCLSRSPRPGVPNFGLDDNQRLALRSFISGPTVKQDDLPPWTRAQDSLRRHNCLGCHARYGEGGHGISTQLPKLLGQDQELNALKGTLNPPDLSSVGAKLRREYLVAAVKGEAPLSRPWLSVRMPRFAFEPGEAEAIVDYFLQMDRVDQDSKLEPNPRRTDQEIEPGVILLGREGFGCVSCHVIDGKIPPGGEAETLGPDLALAHQRMTRSYFDRWLSDPQRILPGTSMPQFLIPSPGIEGTVSEQLGMVWDALGHPDLSELTSTATRQFLTRQGDRALVVRDMVVLEEDPSVHLPRAIAIGLTGERSLVFDSDRLSWIRWWDQGFLHRTKQGRLWEWHPEGRALWENETRLPPVIFSGGEGALLLPGEHRSRFGSFVELRFEEKGVRLEYALSLPTGGSIQVIESISPTKEGWSRRVEMGDVPDHLVPRIVVASGAAWDARGSAQLPGKNPTVTLQAGSTGKPIEASVDPRFEHMLLIEPEPDARGTWRGEVILSINSESEEGRGDR